MENKNSCKENFEMAKTELQDMEAIADFFSNPMIKSEWRCWVRFRGSAVWQRIFWNRRLPGFRKETGRIPKLYYRVGGADCKK